MKKETDNLETRVKKLEEQQKQYVNITKKHAEILQEFLGAAKDVFAITKINLEKIREESSKTEKFINKKFPFVVSFVILLIYRKEINLFMISIYKKLVQFWHTLSENWQTALFTVLATSFVSIISIYLDRRFRK